MTPAIIKSFLPVFYVSKYFGCNLYSLPKGLNSSNLKTSIRAVDVLIYLAHVLVSICITIPFVKKWSDEDSIYSKSFSIQSKSSGLIIIGFIGREWNFMSILTNLFIMTMDMINSTTIRRMLLSFINLDEMMRRGSMKTNFSYRLMSLLYGFIFLFGHLMIASTNLVVPDLGDGRLLFNIEMYAGNCLIDGCTCSFLITYWYFIKNIADRFCILNHSLRKYLTGKMVVLGNTSSVLTATVERKFFNDYAQIRNFSKIYQNIVDIIRDINRCYTLQFILSALNVFLFTTINAYVIYHSSVHGSENDNPLARVFFFSRLFYFHYAFYRLIATGSTIMKEGKISQSLVNKAISLSENKSVSTQLSNFSHQMEHSCIAVTCGMFSVDWTLFYTFATATLTYSLLFIQFDTNLIN